MWDLIVSVPDHCLSFYIEFRNHFIVSAIKFGESLSKFMIPIALLEKFGS